MTQRVLGFGRILRAHHQIAFLSFIKIRVEIKALMLDLVGVGKLPPISRGKRSLSDTPFCSNSLAKNCCCFGVGFFIVQSPMFKG